MYKSFNNFQNIVLSKGFYFGRFNKRNDFSAHSYNLSYAGCNYSVTHKDRREDDSWDLNEFKPIIEQSENKARFSSYHYGFKSVECNFDKHELFLDYNTDDLSIVTSDFKFKSINLSKTSFRKKSNSKKEVKTQGEVMGMPSYKYFYSVLKEQEKEIYAELRKIISNKKANHLSLEWMHCLAKFLHPKDIEPQDPKNLGIGTYGANTEMIIWEVISKYFAMKYKVNTKSLFELYPNTQIVKNINYKIEIYPDPNSINNISLFYTFMPFNDYYNYSKKINILLTVLLIEDIIANKKYRTKNLFNINYRQHNIKHVDERYLTFSVPANRLMGEIALPEGKRFQGSNPIVEAESVRVEMVNFVKKNSAVSF